MNGVWTISGSEEENNYCIKKRRGDFPDSPVVKSPGFQEGVLVQSLIRELRSCLMAWPRKKETAKGHVGLEKGDPEGTGWTLFSVYKNAFCKSIVIKS